MSSRDVQSARMKTKVIACGVFERELDQLCSEAPERFQVVMMDAGLHARPKELKARLQAGIDETDACVFDRIVVLYGLCGRGAIGILARDIPLVFPRIHDCIALFLGSADEYWRQFRACPATFYMTPGWFEKKAHPDGYKITRMQNKWTPEGDPQYGEWSEHYGPENATFIVEFFQSWRKNYQRIALINNGLGDVDRYRQYVQALAEVSGWRFEELPGEMEFMDVLVHGGYDEKRFLVVPPHHMVIATNDTRIFTSVPADPSEEDVLSATRALSGVQVGRFVFDDAAGPGPRAIQKGVGLGIDAGGTYTDAVLMDFETMRVVCKAKAPTTPHDYSVGIEGAVSRMAPEVLARVSLVSLSTTLATNAIVENRGAHVGLILMPIDEKALGQIRTRPVRIVPGKMTITGEQLEPVDPAAVETAVQQMLAEGVEAFAVSGYGGVHNPVHEKQVKEIIERLADVPVVCGHELSGKLNFIRRAHTAVLNARLIPIIDELLQAVEQVLKRYHVKAPIFIVRGDATLVEMSAARERAIETILSGPAASAIGARFLTGADDLIAVDVGGTTTDVAIVEGGRVAVCDAGAVVGPWQTSVSAADIQTTGLGGDSYVRCYDGGLKLSVGPERVTPLSFLAMKHAHVTEELAELADRARFDMISPQAIEFFELIRPRPGLQLQDREAPLLDALRRQPLSRNRLAPKVGALAIELLPTARLEQLGIIRRCAFTPTDMLHVMGDFNAYNTDAAQLAVKILAGYAGRKEDEFLQWVRDSVLKKLAYEIVRREMTADFGDPDQEKNPMLRALLNELVASRMSERAAFSIRFDEHRPVVGIGAPAGAFLPDAGRLLAARVLVPEHAEVANAVGAVTGNVVVRESVSIRPDESGSFIMMSPLGRKEFGHLREAQREATQHLVYYLRRKAVEYGTDQQEVVVKVGERTGQLNDGSRQFLELVVEGVLEGPPRVAATV